MKRRNALSPEYSKENKFMPNQNKTSWIQIRCTQQEKAAIVRQLKDSEKLSEFMLNAASEKIISREKEAVSHFEQQAKGVETLERLFSFYDSVKNYQIIYAEDAKSYCAMLRKRANQIKGGK